MSYKLIKELIYMQKPDYRKRIYQNYSANFQDLDSKFDISSATRWSKSYHHYLKGWLPNNKNNHIVDLACGGGKLLHFFKSSGYSNVTGVDISPDQVHLSKQVIPDVREMNILEFLESEEDSFDLITGIDIVEHFHKDEVLRFLDGCYTALKPGGRLILQTPNANSPWGTVHRYNDFTHEVCFNFNSLSRLLQLCNFNDVEGREVGPVPMGYSKKSTIRYVAWQAIRTFLKLWNIAETGGKSDCIFTRVFLVSATK